MKILFAIRNPSFYLHYRDFVDNLLAAGHSVTTVLASDYWKSAGIATEILDETRARWPGRFEYGPMQKGASPGTRLIQAKRALLDYLFYLKSDHPISESPYMRMRAFNVLPGFLKLFAARKVLARLMARDWMFFLLRALERVIDVDRPVYRHLQELHPDVVVATPYIFANSWEIDYVKAARRLNIPTAVFVYSWDNLTTKGTFHILPERVYVWNEVQRGELENIHNIAGDHVVVAGAPSMDYWFEHKADVDYQEFCRLHGLDPRKKTVTYLCSSQTIAPDENILVRRIVDACKSHFGQKCPNILIRPHPLNQAIWQDHDPDLSVVSYDTRDVFYKQEGKSRLFNTFYFSECMIGLNTTAILEGSILGRPSIILVTDRYSGTQGDTRHFRILENSGVMYVTHELPQLLAQMGSILEGKDVHADRRMHFVEAFIRPTGRVENVSSLLAGMLQAA